METHAAALSEDHPMRLGARRYLAGLGTVELRTRPAAEVLVERYVERDRRLVLEPVQRTSTPADAFLDGGPECPGGRFVFDDVAYEREPSRQRAVRGGGWAGTSRYLAIGTRASELATARYSSLSFRLARPL
ncbi:MAG: hypothetical protein GY913_32975 [Proteobacteria bacterium]|nr:hypothetical protein [Pseudomonadota bacterium]